MDKVALLPPKDRAALFGETGAGRGVANTIIEKDFWVCWTLKRLFGMPGNDNVALVFKGGTSLSKAFGAIRRFSEDIDLTFARADLGFTGSRDPARGDISRKKADQLIEDLMREVQTHIRESLLPKLRGAIAQQLGAPTDRNWSLEIDDADAHTVNFHYPTVLSEAEYGSIAYISPRVRLEFGARGDPWPSEARVIRPYAADDYPDFFVDADVSVTVLAAQRTFWEKATALHAEAHRPADSATPPYFSRHYYDLATLLNTAEGKAAAADYDLLATVAKHKAAFFRSSWASYHTACPGTIRLLPDAARIDDLRTDYRAMAPMMFDERPPAFDEILATLQRLQETING
ncbi:MAG: nucleotidyl transferase AbiEii/AbiGii toxin family protein [Gemmatimonadaceae bacterium]|nr:nucleotidyl transferase AbiEii/AbiGii toxin family protein [Gemmatimonadaceae bacterium]